MHRNPFTEPHAADGMVALDDGRGPATSKLLQAALGAGAAIGAALEGPTRQALDPDERRTLERTVATVAAGGAYAGMALWTLNAFTVKSERAGRLAETVAGLGLGLLSARS